MLHQPRRRKYHAVNVPSRAAETIDVHLEMTSGPIALPGLTGFRTDG